MIWFVLAMIIAIIVLIKEKSFGSFILTLGIGCVVALLVAVCVRYAMPDQYEIIREEKLIKINNEESYVSVMNNDNSNSRYSTSPTLVFTVIGKDNAIVTYKTDVTSGMDGSSKTIVETDSVEPKYVRQKMRPMYKYWQLFAVNLSYSKYVLYVPKGSIDYDYNVK